MYSGGPSDKDEDKISGIDASSGQGSHGSKYSKPYKKPKKGNHHGSTQKDDIKNIKYGSDQEELPPIIKGTKKPKGSKYTKTTMFPAFKKKGGEHKYVSPYQKKKVGGYKHYSYYPKKGY